MNYPQTLNKAKTFPRQRHYAQAVQTAASALENVMADPYQVVIQPLVEEGGAVVQFGPQLEA